MIFTAPLLASTKAPLWRNQSVSSTLVPHCHQSFFPFLTSRYLPVVMNGNSLWLLLLLPTFLCWFLSEEAWSLTSPLMLPSVTRVLEFATLKLTDHCSISLFCVYFQFLFLWFLRQFQNNLIFYSGFLKPV